MSEIIKLHDLRPAPGEKTPKTRVGRGEGSKGKTAGRGTNGTKARKNVPVMFEGGQMPLQKRLPKYGFTSRLARVTAQIRTAELALLSDEVIDLDALRRHRCKWLFKAAYGKDLQRFMDNWQGKTWQHFEQLLRPYAGQCGIKLINKKV